VRSSSSTASRMSSSIAGWVSLSIHKGSTAQVMRWDRGTVRVTEKRKLEDPERQSEVGSSAEGGRVPVAGRKARDRRGCARRICRCKLIAMQIRCIAARLDGASNQGQSHSATDDELLSFGPSAVPFHHDLITHLDGRS
jgi:hypothetical protein